jgi:HK97 family phage major capsid protein
LEAYVNDRLRYGVLFEEERQLLYGTGSSPQIQGILTEIGVQNYNWSDGVVTPVDSKIDAIRRAMGQAQVNEHNPTGLVVNSVDWTDIQLAKGTDGHYIWASVGSGTEQRFFLLPIAVTNAIASGTALIGAFQTATTLWDREQVGIRVSESHASFFIENMVAILAEERVSQTIYRPDAFVTVTFDAAPS